MTWHMYYGALAVKTWLACSACKRSALSLTPLTYVLICSVLLPLAGASTATDRGLILLQAGTDRCACSFQHVTCAMLHLVTLPVLMNSLLTQCYNPILATIANNLDMNAVCDCIQQLSLRGSIGDRNLRPYDQVCHMTYLLCI